MNSLKSIHYFTVICNTKNKNSIIELLENHGARGIEVIYGRGSAKKGVLAQAFGFDTEEKKAIVLCFVSSEKANELMDILYNECNFKETNTGVAFSTEIEGLVF